jgi:hypothetical protein
VIPEDAAEAALARLSEGCCPNGAAEYLFVAGILILVLHLVGIMLTMARRCAEKVGLQTFALVTQQLRRAISLSFISMSFTYAIGFETMQASF